MDLGIVLDDASTCPKYLCDYVIEIFIGVIIVENYNKIHVNTTKNK